MMRPEEHEDDIGMSTEPIDLSADLTQEVDDEELVADLLFEEKPVELFDAPGLRPEAPTRPAGRMALWLAILLLQIATVLLLWRQNALAERLGYEPDGPVGWEETPEWRR